MSSAPTGVVVTLDIDWAPDFMIDWAADRLADAGVRATWFVTHQSPAVVRLAGRSGLFELGVHPNFLPGSSHGDDPRSVLEHCLELVPGAKAMRTHCLVQSLPLLDAAIAAGLELDASVYLPGFDSAGPVVHESDAGRIVRVPYIWQDDLEAASRESRWRLDDLAGGESSLRILDFHPVHLYLNSSTLMPYRRLKQVVQPLTQARPEDADSLVGDGDGARTMFEDVVGRLGSSGGGFMLRDVQDSLGSWR